MFEKFVSNFDKIIRQYTPDPFVIAIVLTFIAFILGIGLTDSSAVQMVEYWGGGFWKLIAFTLQMVMILLGGYVVARSKPVEGFLKRIAGFINSPSLAVVATVIIACTASWLNWGFGLVVGAIVALEMAKSVPGCNFRLLVASAYAGFIVWHGGLSGSIPLLLNTKDNFSQKWLPHMMDLSMTTFSSFNIISLASVVVTLIVVSYYLSKFKDNNPVNFHTGRDEFEQHKSGAQSLKNLSFSEKLERSRILAIITTIFGFSFICITVYKKNFNIDLNTINFILIFVGLLFHGRFTYFLRAVKEGAGKVGPILIQYPLYAGIMAMLTGSGLATLISEMFIEHSSETTFPLLSFYSAGLTNMFVPSGGGQWAVQAPVVLPAAETLGADLTKSIMAVAWGDAWTNLAQPFWALPLLAIAGLKIRDIMGYCLIFLVTTGIVLSTLMLTL